MTYKHVSCKNSFFVNKRFLSTFFWIIYLGSNNNNSLAMIWLQRRNLIPFLALVVVTLIYKFERESPNFANNFKIFPQRFTENEQETKKINLLKAVLHNTSKIENKWKGNVH